MAKKTTKATTQAMRNIRSTTTTSSGEKRMSNTPSRSRRKVYTRGGSASDVSYIKVEKKTNATKKQGAKKVKTSGPKAKVLTRRR